MNFFQIITLITIVCTVGTSSAQECGVPIRSGKIVGGVDSGGYHYPWFALLLLKTKASLPIPICGGSLISANIILTAAHCFGIDSLIPNIDLFTVALGVYDICDSNEPTRQLFNVEDVIIHEKYVKRGKFFDIALMKLDKPADYRVVCLPLSGVADKTEKALLIGFGVTSENSGATPCRMLEVNVTKFSREECSNTQLPLQDKREPSVICAGVLSGGADSCYGDSGGPLLTQTPDGRYVIEGIVSYGYGCGTPQIPGVYTNVGSYIQWINNKISQLNHNKGRGISTPNNTKSFSRKRTGLFRREHKIVKFPGTGSAKNVGETIRINPRMERKQDKDERDTGRNTRTENVKKKSTVTFPQ